METSKDLLSLETKQSPAYPSCLLLRKQESKPYLRTKTQKINSTLLPKLKAFLSKVSDEKTEKKINRVEDGNHKEQVDQQPEIELNVAFLKISKEDQTDEEENLSDSSDDLELSSLSSSQGE